MDTTPITDPLLQRVLSTAHETRAHCLATLAFLASEKQSKSQDDAPTQSTLQSQLRSQLAVLRGRHRAAVLSVRANKADTLRARAAVDALHLQLANDVYEEAHLAGEIDAARAQPHRYEELGLAAIGEEELAREIEARGEKEVMLGRIEEERLERKRLDGLRAGLVARRAELVAANAARREELEKLDREVESWLAGGAKIGAVFAERRRKAAALGAGEDDAARDAEMMDSTDG